MAQNTCVSTWNSNFQLQIAFAWLPFTDLVVSEHVAAVYDYAFSLIKLLNTTICTVHCTQARAFRVRIALCGPTSHTH